MCRWSCSVAVVEAAVGVAYLFFHLPIFCVPAILKTKPFCGLPPFSKMQKWSNAASLRQCLNLTAWKMTQFCEPSIFEVDNIKNEAILWGLLQRRKVDCRADGLVPLCLWFFFSTSTAPPMTQWGQVKGPAAHVTQNQLENLKIWFSKSNPFEEICALTS